MAIKQKVAGSCRSNYKLVEKSFKKSVWNQTQNDTKGMHQTKGEPSYNHNKVYPEQGNLLFNRIMFKLLDYIVEIN